MIITNKNGKYELTDELPNDVRLKNSQSQNSMELYSNVQFPSHNENIVKLLKLE